MFPQPEILPLARICIFEISPNVNSKSPNFRACGGQFCLTTPSAPVNNPQIVNFSRLQRAYMSCRFYTTAQTSLGIFYNSPKFSPAAGFREGVVETFYNNFDKFQGASKLP